MRAVITYVPTEYNFPNLTIEGRCSDGVLVGYRLTANEGYVFYDINAHDTELDPETMEEIPVTYYYTLAYLPRNCNFANFHYAAVPRSEVPENMIFGAGSNNHETA